MSNLSRLKYKKFIFIFIKEDDNIAKNIFFSNKAKNISNKFKNLGYGIHSIIRLSGNISRSIKRIKKFIEDYNRTPKPIHVYLDSYDILNGYDLEDYIYSFFIREVYNNNMIIHVEEDVNKIDSTSHGEKWLKYFFKNGEMAHHLVKYSLMKKVKNSHLEKFFKKIDLNSEVVYTSKYFLLKKYKEEYFNTSMENFRRFITTKYGGRINVYKYAYCLNNNINFYTFHIIYKGGGGSRDLEVISPYTKKITKEKILEEFSYKISKIVSMRKFVDSSFVYKELFDYDYIKILYDIGEYTLTGNEPNFKEWFYTIKEKKKIYNKILKNT